MAANEFYTSGISILHLSDDPTDYVRVPVAGNVEIAIGELITLSSGKATAFATANADTDTDNFVGVAVTAHNDDGSASDVDYITVCTKAVIKATFASAPANTIYIGTGVKVSTAANHEYTFTTVTNGVNQCGWLMENGDGSSTELKVLIDTMATSHGAQSAGQGFWQCNAAE